MNPLSSWTHRTLGQNLAPECLGLDYNCGWVVAVLSVFALACRILPPFECAATKDFRDARAPRKNLQQEEEVEVIEEG